MSEELLKQIKGKEEVWKPIKGYEGLYEIGNRGSVYNVRTKKVMEPVKTKPSLKSMVKRNLKPSEVSPYFTVGLTKDGIRKTFKIHRLVAQAFIPNPENKPLVNHINEVTTDNRVQNLEWSTGSENKMYSYNLRKKESIKIDMIKKMEPAIKIANLENDYIQLELNFGTVFINRPTEILSN